MDKLKLMKTANEVRKDIVTAVHSAKAGHPGGSLSAADIFTYLYFEEMNIDPQDPKKADRDRFVLSKGHTAPGLYSVLAERGYFPKEDLKTLRHTGSYLQGHPDMKHIPGVDMSSGSLGQGISAASRASRPTSSPLPGRTRQRGRGVSPRLPRWPRSACPDAAGRGPKYETPPFDPAARTAFTPLPAPEFERCRFLRPPRDPPSHANLTGCAGLEPAGSLLRHPLERPQGPQCSSCSGISFSGRAGL